MQDFVADTSRWRIALSTLGSVGFLVLGLWMVGAFGEVSRSSRYSFIPNAAIGWVAIIMGGFFVLSDTRKFFKGGVQLEIGARGIRSKPWSDDLIPWSEIADVKTQSVRGSKFIVLHLRDATRFPGRGLNGLLSRATPKFMHAGDVSISLAGTNRSYGEAMSAIAHFRKSAS